MALTDVGICNMALSHIGAKKITALDGSDTSSEATQCIIWYDICRQQLLEMYSWNFARKRATLTAHADAVPSGIWSYRYTYPADCLKARRIVNPLGDEEDAVPFDIELSDNDSAKTILTDEESAILIYTKDVTTVTIFSPVFVTLLSHLLASRLAYPITADVNLELKENRIFGTLFSYYTAIDANEGIMRTPREADAIRARTS